MTKNKIARQIYFLFRRLFSALAAFFNELFMPTSFIKGEDFEKCLREYVYPAKNFDLLMKTHNFKENRKDYVASSLYPDYLFRDIKSGNSFFVEAKYRENFYRGGLEWCKPFQYNRYKEINKETDVFIAIGYQGRPRNPKHIFLIPFDDLSTNYASLDLLKYYEYKKWRTGILDFIPNWVYNFGKN